MTVAVDEKTITYAFKLNEKLQNKTLISFNFTPSCEIDGILVNSGAGSSVFVSNISCFESKLDHDINCMGKKLAIMANDQQQKCIRNENILEIYNRYGIKTTLEKPADQKRTSATPGRST